MARNGRGLIGGLATNNPAIVVREDPVNRNLLFAGTEFGLFVSLNAGTNWSKFGGLPPVRIDDLKIHAREGDLVIGTHGRSLYVVDDTRALRELTSEVAGKPAHLFTIRPAHGRLSPSRVGGLPRQRLVQRRESPEGALLTVWIREFTGERFTLTIKNASGQPVARFEQGASPGLTRLNWNLRLTETYRRSTAAIRPTVLFRRATTPRNWLTGGPRSDKRSR